MIEACGEFAGDNLVCAAVVLTTPMKPLGGGERFMCISRWCGAPAARHASDGAPAQSLQYWGVASTQVSQRRQRRLAPSTHGTGTHAVRIAELPALVQQVPTPFTHSSTPSDSRAVHGRYGAHCPHNAPPSQFENSSVGCAPAFSSQDLTACANADVHSTLCRSMVGDQPVRKPIVRGQPPRQVHVSGMLHLDRHVLTKASCLGCPDE